MDCQILSFLIYTFHQQRPWAQNRPRSFNPIALRKAKTLLHSERPKLFGVLAVLSAIGLKIN